jgi:transcriptional regulator with XRE-family HTH domain
MYGTFIRRIRTSRGLTQAQLAEVAGIPQPNLSAIERGHRLPSADTLNRIVVACGYELAAVAGERRLFCDLPAAGWFPDEGDPEPVPGDPNEPPALSADATIEQRLAAIHAALEVASMDRRWT